MKDNKRNKTWKLEESTEQNRIETYHNIDFKYTGG